MMHRALSAAAHGTGARRKPAGSFGGLAVGLVWLNSAQLSSAATSAPAVVFAKHIAARDVKNPFPGIPRVEKMIGRKIVARIGSNEAFEQDPSTHPLGSLLSKELLDLVRLYPDPYATRIREQLAAITKTPVEEIVTDTGADSLIALAIKLRVSPGDTVVTSAGTYPTFSYFANGAGANIFEVPYASVQGGSGGELLRPDLDALARAAREHGAVMAYLANPDNPSGHVSSAADVAALRAALPAECTLLLDEAYIDFAPQHAVAERLPNTVQTRTLSKAWGLAGLRLGYALADRAWAAKADSVRTQFSAASLSNVLIERVLEDPQFSATLVADTEGLRARLADALVARGAHVLPSATNFVAVLYPTAEAAAERQQALLSSGVSVHRPPHAAMQRLLRISASPQALDPAVLDVLAPPPA